MHAYLHERVPSSESEVNISVFLQLLVRCLRNGTAAVSLPCWLHQPLLHGWAAEKAQPGACTCYQLQSPMPSGALSESPCHLQSLLTREHLVHFQKGHGSLFAHFFEKLTFSVIWKERRKEATRKISSLLVVTAGCLSPCLLSTRLNFLTWNCWFFNVSLYIIISLLVFRCSTTHIAIAWSKQAW